MDERREAKVGKVGKDDGNRWRNVLPQPRSLKSEEKNTGDDNGATGGNVDRPLPCVLPSTAKTKHCVAIEILMHATKVGVLGSWNRDTHRASSLGIYRPKLW